MRKRGYTYKEAGAYLGMSETYVKRLVAANVLAARYQGSKPVIDEAELDRYFDSLPFERA